MTIKNSQALTGWMMAAVKPFGQRVVVVGGGAVARRRAELFASRGAIVKVFDPHVDAATEWPEGITFYRRRVSKRDLQTAWIVVVATNDPEVNARVGGWVNELGLECNRADDVEAGTFAVPSLIEDEQGWQLAILGGEAGPLFSTWLKGILQHVISLPKINEVHRALATARHDLTRRNLDQESRAEILRGVMARVLEAEEGIDSVAVIEELLRKD